MDFLGIGAGEVLLVLIIALIVWGPRRIIEISRSLGKTLYAFKKVASELTNQVTREIEDQKKAEIEISPQKDSPADRVS